MLEERGWGCGLDGRVCTCLVLVWMVEAGEAGEMHFVRTLLRVWKGVVDGDEVRQGVAGTGDE